MRIGLALPQYDYSVPGESPLMFDTVAEHARRAEAAGYDSLWVSDHLFLDIGKYGGSSEPVGAFEPIATLGALAGVVDRVRLGTLVLCEALRPPTVAAKALATLDRLTGGRLDVGLGAGWYEPEYAAIGMAMPPPGERIRRLREATQIVTGLLGGDPLTFDGEFFHTDRRARRPPGHPAAAPAGVPRREGRPPARDGRGVRRRVEHVLGVDARRVPGAARRARRARARRWVAIPRPSGAASGSTRSSVRTRRISRDASTGSAPRHRRVCSTS